MFFFCISVFSLLLLSFPSNSLALPSKVTCSPFICLMYCESGRRVDINGCDICACIDPCENPICLPGEKCVRKKVECVTSPCYDVSECVPGCPQIKCANQCTSGFQLDQNGCQTCQCIDPCENKVCPFGKICERIPTICKKPPCYDRAECISTCLKQPCEIECKSGYREDLFGCRLCQCIDPCENYKCPLGQTCMREKVFCFAPPCYDVPNCRKTECPMFKCKHCQSGYLRDENGCQTCTCLDPCENMVCGPNEVCEEQVVLCVRAPCPPIGICIPKKKN